MKSDLETQFLKLNDIMKTLRAPGGCPWDREQTHETLTKYCMEEAFEVVDAIDQKDDKLICEELGDLLLQVVFHADIAKERKAFEMKDIIGGLNDKLIRRHPHVFPSADKEHAHAATAEDVVRNWEEIKKKEGKKNVLDGVPKQLPALLRAARLGEKAAQVGFDWQEPQSAYAKIKEELREIEEVVDQPEKLSEELGDLLFAVAQYARHKKIDPEQALRAATQKFEKRFYAMEDIAKAQGSSLKEMTFEAPDALWNRVKLNNNNK